MELHTRDAKDDVALAQLGAAAILLWHNVPRGMRRTCCMWPRPYMVYRRSPTLDSGCSVSSRATNSLASDQEMVPIAARERAAARCHG